MGVRITRVIGMCLLLAAGALNAGDGDKKDPKDPKEPKNDPSDVEPVRIRGRQKAAEFADVDAWINSKPLTMEKLKGKVIVVHFMSVNSVNCARNYPWYKEIVKDYKDKDVVVLGIHTPETAGEKNLKLVKKKVEEEGLTFPIAVDNKTTMWRRYGNTYWPSIYLVDRKGIARWGWAGELGWKGAKGEMHMRKKIDELLDD